MVQGVLGNPKVATDDLREENEALKARVAQLEAELEARPRVERLPMFALLDVMPMLVGAISQDGTCEYVSPAFRPWLVGRRAEITDHPFLPGLIESLREPAGMLIAAALVGQLAQRTVSVRNRDGELRDLQITLAPRKLGDAVNGCIWVAQDLTHLRHADEALRASEQRFRLAADAAGLGVWDRDLSDDFLIFSDQARAIYGFPPDGVVTLDMVRAATHPDDVARTVEVALRHMDPKIRSREPGAYRVIWPDGQQRWVLAHGEAVFEPRDEGEVAVRYIGMLQDITEQTLADQRRQFLLHELNHRVKNTLASVQSIAHLSLRDAQSVAQTRTRLTDRLIALAGAHDLLTREDWRAADVIDIVAAAVSPYETPQAPRFVTDGPSAPLAPKAAVALALALHELGTNAAKYGALSTEAGRIGIAWTIEAGEEPLLTLDWRESGGPPVRPPSRSGFGTRLLTQGLAAEFGGGAKLDYRPDGLTCRITARLTPQTLLELG